MRDTFRGRSKLLVLFFILFHCRNHPFHQSHVGFGCIPAFLVSLLKVSTHGFYPFQLFFRFLFDCSAKNCLVLWWLLWLLWLLDDVFDAFFLVTADRAQHLCTSLFGSVVAADLSPLPAQAVPELLEAVETGCISGLVPSTSSIVS